MPEFDPDAMRNLAIADTVMRRVADHGARADIDVVLLEQRATRAAIDQIAYDLFDVSEERTIIERALGVIS